MAAIIWMFNRLEPAQLERAQEIYRRERNLPQREEADSLREQLIRPREDINPLREHFLLQNKD